MLLLFFLLYAVDFINQIVYTVNDFRFCEYGGYTMPFFCFIAAETMGDKWATSGITTLIGLGMTFVILTLLIGTILLMRLILREFEKLKPDVKNIFSKKKKIAVENVTIVSDTDTSIKEKEIDEETYNAIRAAVFNYTKKDDNVVIIKSVSRATEATKPIEDSDSTQNDVTAPAPTLPTDGKQIKAPMPGTLLKIVASNGKQVKEGETIFVLEAMKMENDIVSPATGTIRISVTEGAKVNTGDLLAVIK